MEADLKHEYRGMRGLNALYRRLVAKQFTKVADLHDVLRSEYLRMRFNVGPYRVEHIKKHRKQRRQLTKEHKKVMRPLPSSFKNYSEVFARLGYPVDIRQFHSIFTEEGGNLNMLPKEIGPKKNFQQWIGIAPFAAHEGKVYPPRLMEQVIQQLIQKYPKARIFLFGRGKQEEEVFSRWVEQMPQCLYVGKHLETMQQELILMSHLDVMISMDSANMHLASLTATPVVSVWGATHPLAGFMGWNQSEENAVQIDMPCRPCSIYGQKPCKRGDYQCLRGIAPDVIVGKVEKILSDRP
jgi:ADP-heptose:LPS heptosyltransferase